MAFLPAPALTTVVEDGRAEVVELERPLAVVVLCSIPFSSCFEYSWSRTNTHVGCPVTLAVDEVEVALLNVWH